MSHSTVETGATNATTSTSSGTSAPGVDTRLFSGVRFRLNSSLRKEVRKQVEYCVLSQLLVSNGATEVPAENELQDPTLDSDSREQAVDHSLTHWITDTLDIAEYAQLRPNEDSSNALALPAPRAAAVVNNASGGTGKMKNQVDEQVKIVTPYWVTRSYDLQQLQQPRHYSADPLLIFSGLCVCCDGLPETDAQSIAAGVQSLGGQSRRELTREVTHLLLMSPEGVKYEAWLKHGAAVGMVALLPHWFEDCFKLRQLIPHDIYAFPDPPYINLRTIDSAKSYDERLFDLVKTSASTNGRSQTISVEQMSATKRLELAFSRLSDNEPYQRTALIELDRSHVGGTIALSEPGVRARIGAATTVGSSSTLGGTTSRSTVATLNGSWPPVAGLATSTDASLFSGHRVYLASDLGLRPGLEEAIQNRIIEAGGRCWSFGLDGGKSGTGKNSLLTSTEERKGSIPEEGTNDASVAISKRDRTDEWDRRREAERELHSSTIVITRTRQGWEWWLAYEAGLSTFSSVDSSPKKVEQRRHKIIGNLAWVYHVLAVGKLDPPSSRILHFPLPSLEGVPELRGQLCTISNYSGSARDYVRAMIEALGATFDGAMCKQTKFVITASEFGNKVKHARQWGIPLVTHTWLEACLAKWAFINPALSTTYLVEGTSPAIAFPQMVGEARLSKANIEDWVQRDEVKVLREEALSSGLSMREEEEGMGMEGDEEGWGGKGERGDVVMEDGQTKSPSSPKSRKRIDTKSIVTKSKTTKGKQVVVTNNEDSSEEETTTKVAPKKKMNKTAVQAPAIKRKRSSSGLTSLSPEPEPKVVVVEEEEQAPASVTKATTSGKKGDAPAKSKNADPATPAAKVQAGRGRSDKSSTRKGKKKADSDEDDDGSSSSSSDSGPEPSFTKTFGQIDPANMIVGGSRRAAAGKAAQLLAQQMPDAIRFAKEQKSADKKKKVVTTPGPAGTATKRGSMGPLGSAKREDGESQDEDEVMKRRDDDEKDEAPAPKPKAKPAKKRKPNEVSEPKDDEDEEHVPNGGQAKKRAKTVAATAPKGGRLAATMATDATTSGQISSFDAPPRGKPALKNGGRKLMLMSTGLGLDAKSPEIKSLKPLGITWTDNPSLVTHLVVRAMQRTEKFLCCEDSSFSQSLYCVYFTHRIGVPCAGLGVAPKIVTKEWIDASLKANELVDEEPYLLKDTVREREYKDTLVEILKRARTKQLFEDYTVYITPGTQPEPKTMQRICQSGGATVSLARLTPPIINKIVENRERTIVVSCPGDRREWEALARKKLPIFSVEAVFNSVMHQTLVGFDTASNNRIDGLQLDR
ncbi:BQ5605_C010g06196 [Microbotryum silenes-dioicae]|uniref:BQ5605_C010g06196 protein n=1 Tax=Microbotryum silenes-dioicae TaxID=796604 RepID=A0A2X0NUT4_9BASI|nr:BQ5605_C010g06196 [Microbotryum silenes-dioicae]